MAKLHSTRRTCANVNYDTHKVVFKKSKQYMKQIVDLLAVNINTISPFLYGIGISKKSILTSVNRQKCVPRFVNMGEYWKTSGSQTDAARGSPSDLEQQVGWGTRLDAAATTCVVFKLETIFEP